MNVLGLSFHYHDAAASLVIAGRPIAMAQEERFSRKKNDPSFPKEAIAFCLSQAKIKTKDLDAIVFYEKPFLKFERILLSSLTTYPKGWRLFREAMKEWFFHKLWVKQLIQEKTGVSPEKIFFAPHHLSHAASAYYASGLSESAIVTIDGVGEWATATIGHGKGSNITLLNEIRFPHSLGLFYSTFTAFLGFKVNEGEYKVMGMAGFGKPRFVDKVKKLILIHQDGSFSLNLPYFAHMYSPDDMVNKQFLSLFGEPREKKSLFFTKTSGFPKYFGKKPRNYTSLAKKNQYYADIAASLQEVTEKTILNIVKTALAKTSSKNLCMAGGVALNSVANGKIAKKFNLDNFFIQPAAGDAGGALGAALYYFHKKQTITSKLHEKDNRRHDRRISALPKFTMTHSLFGKAYQDKEIQEFLKKNAIPYVLFSTLPKLTQHIANEIALGKVIGWFHGRSEWGPRALGNRSILGDPRNHDMKNIINTKIKFREPYRPFAPSVLDKYASEYFDYQPMGENDPANFMILVVPVKKEKRKIIPAVTHTDGTGRLQIVQKKTNPIYWRLINAFYKKTGVPVLLNTSFNLRGEPIVESPENAYSTFLRSDIDMLVMGRYCIDKRTL